MDNENFSADFLAGQKDCRKGIGHKPGQTDAYDRGYSAEYQSQAISDHKTGVRHDR